MRWRRRREEAQPQGAAPGTLALAPRVERALVTLAVHAQQLDGRLERLERRMESIEEEVDEAGERQPSHSDLLEIRLHSARVAAELARVRVELRSEIDDVGEAAAEAMAAGRAAMAATEKTARRDDRVRTLAEQVLDLSDAIDTRPSDVRHLAS